MKPHEEILERFPILASVAPDDRRSLLAHLEEKTYDPGQRIYAEGDAVASLFLIESGVVDLVAMLETGVEQRFLTVREGGVVGILSLVGSGIAGGSAVVVEPASVLALSRDGLEAFGAERAAAAVSLWQAICRTAGAQMQTIVDDYRRITGWARQVMTTSGLELGTLAGSGRELEIDLLTGSTIRGSLTKVDTTPAGTVLTVPDKDGTIQLIPFHAVARIALAEPLPPASADAPSL